MLSFVLLTAPLAPVNHDVHAIEKKGTSVNVTVWHALQTNGPIRYKSSYNPLKILYNCKQVHKEKIVFFFSEGRRPRDFPAKQNAGCLKAFPGEKMWH